MELQGIFQQGLQKPSVFLDRNIIMPHYTPKELPFREQQILEISGIISSSLAGQRPDNVFIYGKIGTGKTVTARHVLCQLEEFAGKNNSRVACAYINCRNHNSKYKVLLKALKKFYPEGQFIGFSAAFVYEKLVEYAQGNETQIILVLDEIDKVKDLDDLMYALTRCNDEFEKGGVSVIGISNHVFFKDRLDGRTKSSLCEHEIVFHPYNAQELVAILRQRAEKAFKPGIVGEEAINLASAIAAQESGDARRAVMLLLRAGEIADREKLQKITDAEVRKAKTRVEEEIIFNMISTLPEQEQLVLYSIARMTLEKKGVKRITGLQEKGVFFSGDVFESYQEIAKGFRENIVSARWYREYISELETYGLIITTSSGKGIRGNTRLIKLGFDAQKIKETLERELLKAA